MADVPCEQNRLAIAFCHPDLGLGGAERLVVDAACELASHGNSVPHLPMYIYKFFRPEICPDVAVLIRHMGYRAVGGCFHRAS